MRKPRDDAGLNVKPRGKQADHCIPVGLDVLPIGVIVPPPPLLPKRLFVYEKAVPETAAVLNAKLLLDTLTPPPVC